MDDSAAPPSVVLQQDGAFFLALTSTVMFQGCRDALVALTPKDEKFNPSFDIYFFQFKWCPLVVFVLAKNSECCQPLNTRH